MSAILDLAEGRATLPVFIPHLLLGEEFFIDVFRLRHRRRRLEERVARFWGAVGAKLALLLGNMAAIWCYRSYFALLEILLSWTENTFHLQLSILSHSLLRKCRLSEFQALLWRRRLKADIEAIFQVHDLCNP